MTTIMKMMRSPLTLVMRRTLGAGLVTSGLLHPVDAFVEVAEVLVAQQRAVAVIDTGLALTAMGKVLISKIYDIKFQELCLNTFLCLVPVDLLVHFV